jgi:hypothetical protein
VEDIAKDIIKPRQTPAPTNGTDTTPAYVESTAPFLVTTTPAPVVAIPVDCEVSNSSNATNETDTLECTDFGTVPGTTPMTTSNETTPVETSTTTPELIPETTAAPAPAPGRRDDSVDLEEAEDSGYSETGSSSSGDTSGWSTGRGYDLERGVDTLGDDAAGALADSDSDGRGDLETAAELEGGDVPLHVRRRMLLWQIIEEEKARGTKLRHQQGGMSTSGRRKR